MPCTIAITNVSADPTTNLTTDVVVTGTISGCTSNQVQVSITCGPQIISGIANVVAGTWSVLLTTKCLCGDIVSIDAVCTNDATCNTAITQPLDCNCCPTITSFFGDPSLCNENQLRYVSFSAAVDVKPQCTATVQVDFGDGNFSSPITLGPGSHGIQLNHYYATGVIYTATINVTQPTPCNSFSINVDCSEGCPPCNTSNILAFICRVFQPLFVFSISVGATIFFANFACLVSAVTAAAVGFLIAAGLFFLVLLFVCRKCICDFIPKLFGQAFLVVGISAFILILPPSCSNWSANPAVLTAVIGVIILIGFLTLFNGWYLVNNVFCPLRLCDYWLAIFYSALIAAIVIVTVFAIITTSIPGGINPFAVLIALFMSTSMMALAGIQIQNLPNCP